MKRILQSSVSRGIICIIASAFFFSAMNVFVRLSGNLPSFEKSIFRNLIAVLVSFTAILVGREGFTYPKKSIPSLILRSVLGTIGILGNYYAVDHLLLADASAIQKLVPFISVIASYFILKEKIRPIQILCIAGAFGGSLFIIRPDLDIFSNMGVIMALVGAFGAGTAYVYVRKISLMKVSRSKIIFFFSLFSVLVMLPFALFEWVTPSLEQLAFLLGAGVMASLGQYAVTFAYSYAPANRISVFDYTQILFSALFGYFLFMQVPDGLSFVGYGLIILFAVINTLASARKRKAD